MSGSASAAARVAGAIGALGYLTGIVDGPIVGALAGLALVTFGRSLVSPRGAELVGPAGFAVLAGAAGAVALRWGTLDLTEIQGAQGVLGPTVAVEPVAVAVLSAAALLASTLALSAWAAHPRLGDGSAGRWWWVELTAGALFLASLFCGPPPSDPVRIGMWLGTAAGVGAAAWFVSGSLPPRSPRGRLLLLGACALVVAAAAGVAGAS